MERIRHQAMIFAMFRGFRIPPIKLHHLFQIRVPPCHPWFHLCLSIRERGENNERIEFDEIWEKQGNPGFGWRVMERIAPHS
jgi:hypothetical protein